MKGMPLIYLPTVDGIVLEDDYYALMDQGKIRDIPYIIGSTKDDICVNPQMKNRGKDAVLYQGVYQFAQKLLSRGKTVPYVYYLEHDLPGDSCGAFHSAELWYMFGTLGRCWRPMQAEDYALSEKMLDYWTAFMKNGNPDPQGQ